jgi:cell division protein FtsL
MLMRKMFPALVIITILTASMFSLLSIKYRVQHLSRDIHEIARQLSEEQEMIHVLMAEWSYVTEPKRIGKLADQYLKLAPVVVAQYTYEAASRPQLEKPEQLEHLASHEPKLELENTLEPMRPQPVTLIKPITASYRR